MNKSYPWQFRVVEFVAYALMLLVPLVFSMDHRHPFIMIKVITAAAGTGTMLLFWVWGMVANRTGLRVTWLHGVILMFLGILTGSALLGFDPHNSLFGDYLRGMSVSYLYVLGLFAVIVGDIARHKEGVIRRLMQSSFVAAVMVAALAFLGPLALNAGWRVTDAAWNGSLIGNSSFAGAYLLFNIFFGAYLVFTSNTWKKRAGWIAGLVVIGLSPIFFNFRIFKGEVAISEIIKNPITLTGEAQGAILGIVAGLVLAIAVWLAASGNRVRKWIGIAMLVIGIAGGVTVGIIGSTPGTKLYESVISVKSENRIVFWEIARNAAAERPWFGWGFQNYSYLYQYHFDERVFAVGYSKEIWTDSPHNVVYEYLSTTGWLGLAAYLSLFVTLITLLVQGYLRNKTPEHRLFLALMLGAIVGYFIQNLFVFDSPAVIFVFFTIIAMVMARTPKTFVIALPAMPRAGKFVRPVIVIMGVGASAFIITTLAILPAREARAWMTIASDAYIEDHPALRDTLQGISWVGTINDTIETDMGFYQPIKDAVQKSSGQERLILAQDIASIVTDLDRELARQPGSARGYYVSAKYLNLAATMTVSERERLMILDKARVQMNQALKINPKQPYFYLELAFSELLAGNKQAAKDLATRAVDLIPAEDDINRTAVQIAVATGDEKLAAELVRKNKEAKKLLPAFNRNAQ